MNVRFKQAVMFVAKESGEILGETEDFSKVKIRTSKQLENDKSFSPLVELNAQKEFLKVITVNCDNIIDKLRDYPSTLMAFFIIARYLKPKYNVAIKDGKPFSVALLAEKMGVTRQMANLHIKRLRELNLVAQAKTEIGKCFAVNPYYVCNGKEVRKDIVDLFETTKATFRNDKTCDIPDGDSKNVNDD